MEITSQLEPRRRRSDWFATGTRSDVRTGLRGLAVAIVALAVVEVAIRHWVPARSGAAAADSPGWLHSAAMGAPAILLFVRAAHGSGRAAASRLAWFALAIGVLIRAGATLLEHHVDGAEVIGVSDLAMMSSYVALAIGVAMLTQRHGHEGLRSVRLDGLITVLSLGAAGSALWFDAILEVSGDPLVVLVALAYPLFDVALLVLVLSGLAPHRYRPTVSLSLLSLGVVGLTVADSVHLQNVAVGALGSELWLQDAWLIGSVLFGIASWAPTEPLAVRPDEANAGISAVPIVFALLAIAVLGMGIDHDVNVFASLLALAAVSLVILRTALTVHELRHTNEISILARTDELTSLTNRRGFLEGLDRLLDVSPGRLAVMVLDLDGFKDVNDSLGHHAGDTLLQLVADRFRACVGTASLLARLGGDEFGVVSVVNDQSMALALAGALRNTLDEPFVVEGVTVRVGASFGVALYPSHGKTRSAVLRCADVAMYDAKRSQAGIAVYRPAIDFNTRDHLQLLTDFRRAIDEQHLTLHYQPKVNLHDGLIIGSEALVRWQHPTRGLLFPDVFVPVAERAGMIPALTRTVLAQAISYHAERFPDLSVSVNISHRDLVDDGLPVYIGDLLDIYRFSAAQLTLEITETALANDPFRAARAITNLRSAGIKISIDDFGVGYSSMARLLELPVDEVKIDKSFVIAMQQDRRAVAIIKSTVELAKALDLHVVAEGIENLEVFKEIARAGVHVAQGYFVSRALTGDDFANFLGSCLPGGATAADTLQMSAANYAPETKPYLPQGRVG